VGCPIYYLPFMFLYFTSINILGYSLPLTFAQLKAFGLLTIRPTGEEEELLSSICNVLPLLLPLPYTYRSSIHPLLKQFK
jgi:hypothetical protein